MKFFLLPLSLLYRTGCWLRSLAYRMKFIQAENAPLPVISVGNISFGGSEKTPMAMDLIAKLEEHGYKPALVSRGYRGRWEKKGGVLSDGKSLLGDWQESGDEPYMVARNFTHTGIFIGKNRLLSCQKAKNLGFDIAVLDDGFQHLRLHKDIDIVMFNPDEKITLRESASSLSRSHYVLIKKAAEVHLSNKRKERIPSSKVFGYSVRIKGLFPLASDQSVPIEAVKNKRILAFSGIASPHRFLELLKVNGILTHAFLGFKDHHPYPSSSLNRIKKTCINTAAEAVITTEKDAVKIANRIDLGEIPLYYLKIDLDIESGFYPQLFSLLKDKEKPGP